MYLKVPFHSMEGFSTTAVSFITDVHIAGPQKPVAAKCGASVSCNAGIAFRRLQRSAFSTFNLSLLIAELSMIKQSGKCVRSAFRPVASLRFPFQ